MTSVASWVLFARDPAATAGFYRALGLSLESEDHGDGAEHLATDVGGIHVAIYPGEGAPASIAHRRPGETFTGFWVEHLDDVQGPALDAGGRLLQAHQHRDWGCRMLLLDPDGRTIEVNQQGHCPS